jgi:CRISPR/Cas system-associated endonuclease Cas1
VQAVPANALLNYAYAILEAEARIAAPAVGLDPAIGVMHLDARPRNSFVCDLMEPILSITATENPMSLSD